MFAATDQGIWRSDDSGQSWYGAERRPALAGTSGIRRGIDKTTKSIRLYCTVRSKLTQERFTGGVYVSD